MNEAEKTRKIEERFVALGHEIDADFMILVAITERRVGAFVFGDQSLGPAFDDYAQRVAEEAMAKIKAAALLASCDESLH